MVYINRQVGMLFKKQKQKGFTVIELIVVLAVVVLLLAAVLIMYSVARTKSNNARIKSDMDQIRKYAEVVYTENEMQGYCVTGKGCVKSDTRILEIQDDIEKRSKSVPNPVNIEADSTRPATYCVSSVLADGKNFCIDSSANQTGTMFDNGTSGVCGLVGAIYKCQ